jgi:hypothetical protein
MLKKITKRLSYANVMATVAVFCVLGGGMAVAAGLKKNSVGKKQIKSNAVVEKKIADGAVTTNKLADNAVTGAKADESTFGQVPSAANATNAENATNATNAQNATNATNATTSANATLFADRSITQVRGRGDGDGNATQNTLSPAATFEQVITEPSSIPTGGATLVVTASVTASNVSGAESSITCELRDDDGAISQQAIQTIPAGDFASLPMVAFKSYPLGTGVANPQDLSVFCSGADNNAIRFERGNVGIVVSPIGT